MLELAQKKETRNNLLSKIFYVIKKDKHILLLMLPGILYYLIFRFGPMYGLILSFKNFRIGQTIMESKWVGLQHFVDFFTKHNGLRVIKNTFLLNAYSIVFGFPVPIVFAILLNELRSINFKRVVSTVSYLPHFISTVIVVGLVVNMLDPAYGIINGILKSLFNVEPISFLLEAKYFRSIYIISMGIWKDFGWSSIVFLAGLTNIEIEQYESATIDGANRLQRILYITIPGLIPVIVLMLVLNLGRILDVGYEAIILMYNPLTYETADVISSHVYRKGLSELNMTSYATAVGLFQSVVGMIFILLSNRIAKNISGSSLW